MSNNKQTRFSLRKGLSRDLPTHAPLGEPLFCTDTKELYIGMGKGIKPQPVTNKELTDTENIPLQETIEEYMNREVIPFAKYAYIDESKTKIGYEISFTKYFYKYQEPRKTEDIMNEILELDRKLDGVLKELQENE